jgi:hypothetical protein
MLINEYAGSGGDACLLFQTAKNRKMIGKRTWAVWSASPDTRH